MKSTIFVVLLSVMISCLFISCGQSNNLNNHDIEMPSTLHGTVVDSETGEPIATAMVTIKSMISYYVYYADGWTVNASDSYIDYIWGHTYSAVTGTDGRYEILNIQKTNLSQFVTKEFHTPTEKYLITVTANGYETHYSHWDYNFSSNYTDLDYWGFKYYTVGIEPGMNVQYDVALEK